MTSQGHALAAEEGIACLLRRTYRAAEEPASDGEYDFMTYFECADRDVPVFRGKRRYEGSGALWPSLPQAARPARNGCTTAGHPSSE